MKRFAMFSALALLVLGWQVSALSAASTAEFLGQAVECNSYMKELAQMGVDNASNEDVKAFARRLLDEHNRMDADLLKLVKDKKVGVATGTNKEHRDRVAELKKTGKGPDFDKKFLQYAVEEHEKAAKQLEEYTKDSGADADCKACAQKALPTVQKHLEEARALQKKLGA
jgi:putative membrane protein